MKNFMTRVNKIDFTVSMILLLHCMSLFLLYIFTKETKVSLFCVVGSLVESGCDGRDS